MDSSFDEMGPTEGTILTLLDFLVDPLLPARTSSRESVSLSQQEMVAKQVHAVVLLYNYYHRKQYPSLPFLEFQRFCKLALALKPSLQLYFGLMQRTDHDEKDDPDKHLSLTEKAIMNACDIAKSLDGSDNHIIENWPVTKVAVFLVDFRKENCYLFHGSVTQGVWSTIEKEVNASSQGSEAAIDARSALKKNRVIRKAQKENQTTDGTALLQLAYLAVKETCGINQCDLKNLENHLVYSTSKPKTAVRLYIMQCMQTNHDSNLVPINDVMESLRGPLVIKESISWIFTPVVEYFHLLPFADKVSNWLMSSRDMSLNSSQNFEAAQEVGDCNSFHVSMEQPLDSSYHSEAVEETENGASPKSKELPNVSEQNCSVFHENEEPVLRTSEQNGTNRHFKEKPCLDTIGTFESTVKVGNGNSCHLKDKTVALVPKHTEASEARNVSGNHLENTPPCTSQQFVAVKETSEASKEVKFGNSCYLEKKTLPNASHNVEAKEAFRNVKNIQNYEEPHPTEDAEIDRQKFVAVKEASEAAQEVKIVNSCYLEKGTLPYASHNVEAKEVFQNVNNIQNNEEPHPCISQDAEIDRQKFVAVKEASESAKEVRIGNSCCLEKESLPNVLQIVEALEANQNVTNIRKNEEPRPCILQDTGIDWEVNNKSSISRKVERTEPVVYKKRNRSQKTISSSTKPVCKTIIAPTEYPKLEEKPCMELMKVAEEIDQPMLTEGALVVADVPITSSNEPNSEKVSFDDKISDTVMPDRVEMQDRALVSLNSNDRHLRKIETLDSKDNLISQTALKILLRKRELLSLQHRSIADELSLCERSIHTIINGSEDDLSVKLDSILEGCNELCLRTAAPDEERTGLHIQDQDFSPVLKRKRLSEANLSAQRRSPCQELDDICNENFWVLPTYNLSTSEGGFQASVTVKGLDFDCSSDGIICTTPLEARNSAASKLVAKMRSMVAKS